MLVYVDLDNTLIDSVRRYEEEKLVAANLGVSPELYVLCVDELYRRYGRTSYSFELLHQILQEKEPHLSNQILRELERLLLKDYFFPDSHLFLSSFYKEELVLLTSGNPAFQWPKIKTHRIEEHVGRVLIASNKAKIIKPFSGGPTFFVDDAPKDLESVKIAHPEIICIQVRQPPPWESQNYTDFKDIWLPSLSDVTEYIKSCRSRK